MQSRRCRVCQRCAVCWQRQSDKLNVNNSRSKSSGFSRRIFNGQYGSWSYGQLSDGNGNKNKR